MNTVGVSARPQSAPPLIARRFNGIEATEGRVWEGSIFPADQLWSLGDVERTLETTFGDTEAPALGVMERIVGDLATKAQLTHLIKEVTGDRARLREIAAASEIHPLGFYKIPLLSTPDYQLRFNIWFGSAGMEDIHNHKFDFASAVLAGRLATRRYLLPSEEPVRYGTIPLALQAMEDDPVEAQRSLDWHHRQLGLVFGGHRSEDGPKPVVVYQADPTKNGREAMTLLGPGFARLIGGQVILKAGDLYSLLHTTRHTAHPITSGELTATLFLRGRPVIERDTIARQPSNEAVGSVDRPKVRLSPRQVRKALTALVSSLP